MLCLTSFSVDQKETLNKSTINPVKQQEKLNKISFSGVPQAFYYTESHVDIKCKKKQYCDISKMSVEYLTFL